MEALALTGDAVVTHPLDALVEYRHFDQAIGALFQLLCPMATNDPGIKEYFAAQQDAPGAWKLVVIADHEYDTWPVYYSDYIHGLDIHDWQAVVSEYVHLRR